MSVTGLGPGTNQATALNSFEAAQYWKTSLSSSQAAEIEISTAEGDKFTFSSTAQTTATCESFASYDSLGHAKEASSCATQTSVSSSQSYALLIEGDLNRKELQDIQKALQTLRQASTKMQSGNLDGAQNKLQKFETLETLAGISANLTTEKSATVESAVIARVDA